MHGHPFVLLSVCVLTLLVKQKTRGLYFGGDNGVIYKTYARFLVDLYV